jgi:hypothetical protein
MAKRYGHIGQVAQMQAVKLLDVAPKRKKSAKPREAGRTGQALSHH